MTDKPATIQMKVRIPVAMRDEIEAAAWRNHRSINGEILARLEALGRLLGNAERTSDALRMMSHHYPGGGEINFRLPAHHHPHPDSTADATPSALKVKVK